MEPNSGDRGSQPEKTYVYRVLRYVPNLVRDEWVNVGVLVYDPDSGERRLRMIEEPEEYARVRRLHPRADEELLRKLRDNLEERFATARVRFAETGDAANGKGAESAWRTLLGQWDQVLSNALQLAPEHGRKGQDLDFETDSLYADHVAVVRGEARVGVPGSRGMVRNYCGQVWRQAHLWNRIEKSVRVDQFTFPGDPMRIDYTYRRNGTRGFVQTLSVSRAPNDAKQLAYTVDRIRKKLPSTEFTAVTDVHLLAGNQTHGFVQDILQDAGVAAVPMEGFAVWTAKLRPLIQ